MRWEHLTQVPDPIRATMSQAFAQWARQDLGVEHLLDLTLQNEHITRQVLAALVASANAVRVPELCQVVHAAHPEISWRQVFRAVGLFCGLHDRHVQRLHYARRPA